MTRNKEFVWRLLEDVVGVKNSRLVWEWKTNDLFISNELSAVRITCVAVVTRGHV